MSQLGFPNFSNLIFGSGSGSEAGASTGTSGGQSLGTTTQQYLIPGAQPAFNQLTGGLSSMYANEGNNLQGGWQGLTNAVTGGMGGLFNNAMQGANTLGTDMLQNLKNAYGQLWGQQQQGLEDRNLGNTTVADSVQTGDERAYQQNLGSDLEDIYKQQLNVLGNFGSPIYNALSSLGSAGLGAAQNLAQQGLGQMGGLAGQYLGLVGQQGINTQTTSNQFQNNQAQNQAQAWQQQMANASAPGGGGYGGASVGSGGGGGGAPSVGGVPNVPGSVSGYGGGSPNTGTSSGGGGPPPDPNGLANFLGGGGVTNVYNGGASVGGTGFVPPMGQPGYGGYASGAGGSFDPTQANPGGGNNNIITQNPPGSPVGDMQPAPHNEPIPPKPGTRPAGGGFSGYYPKPPMPPGANQTAFGNTFQPGAGMRGGPTGTRPQPTVQQPGGLAGMYNQGGANPLAGFGGFANNNRPNPNAMPGGDPNQYFGPSTPGYASAMQNYQNMLYNSPGQAISAMNNGGWQNPAFAGNSGRQPSLSSMYGRRY